MTEENPQRESHLLKVLREGVSLIQMILFRQIRNELARSYPERDGGYISMLAGALIGEIFNSPNPDERFVLFRKENKAMLEQELLAIKDLHATMLPALTDALRIQALCDSQQNIDDPALLTRANELGLLVLDRPVPMPSTFMTLVRGIGEQHGLIVAPAQVVPEEDRGTVH